MRYPPCLVLISCYSHKPFGVLKSSTAYAMEALIPLPPHIGVKSEIFSSLQIGSPRQPARSTLAHSSRRAEGSQQSVNWRIVRCSGGRLTLRSLRSFSPFPNLDQPARRSIETDSAFHRMNQINGMLLHVSGSLPWSPVGQPQDAHSVGDS